MAVLWLAALISPAAKSLSRTFRIIAAIILFRPLREIVRLSQNY